ncbi:hypothetical protein N9Y42_08670 [Mariniblastus sp.]|nr:hypothetical protein [Mariniblastus sp.]
MNDKVDRKKAPADRVLVSYRFGPSPLYCLVRNDLLDLDVSNAENI